MNCNIILVGDVLTKLKELPDESIDCVVTSPPYWGLRDYGTATWEGGSEGCDHREAPSGATNNRSNNDMGHAYKDICLKCGAKRIDRQIGLEKTPEEYVAKMVAVFREVKRVLKKEGTLWLNLGDSFAGGGRCGDPKHQKGDNSAEATAESYKGIPAKNLVGIPWRVAFALQKDGWILRQDIIWHKPNPMPESVTDRCTKAHEYVFLLAKSQYYFFDNEAIKEPSSTEEGRLFGIVRDRVYEYDSKLAAFGRPRGSHETPEVDNRNRRSVWTITTKPFREAHFATFPEDLVEPMIKAGCPVGGVVLDCFIGSGTTAVVAKRLGRNYIGIELNPKYARMAEVSLASMREPEVMKVMMDVENGKQKTLEVKSTLPPS